MSFKPGHQGHIKVGKTEMNATPTDHAASIIRGSHAGATQSRGLSDNRSRNSDAARGKQTVSNRAAGNLNTRNG
jgi:hypothetical protein